ncbi:MAG: GTPase HflX [Gammaproteobacteria bacterium]|nr:GTPase HflX [Gammaproteobacteria bacterium]NNF60297.1 GTPase HflX [Gammaproteobacteria bacterium]NNM20405.1 GTPase HflX [Gammaproteobacteria bacterium]
MFERPRAGERALLVNTGIGAPVPRDQVAELNELAVSAGARPIAQYNAVRDAPHPKYFIGSGKAAELRDVIAMENIELVIFDRTLSPSQERNLERLFQCRVLDRTGLILDIFAQRAKSHEGKLQVELAQLRHLSTRLVRGWTHLERQKGGIGLRGPGETQLETDRRLLANRIRALRSGLDKIEVQRAQQRGGRGGLATVSLVGYTNAGKSTLFSQLTDQQVYAADKLFATLDTTLRKLELPHGRDALLADTVGFVRDLPHELIAAFRATLQETRNADLLLHVVDAGDENRGERIVQVQQTLEAIGAGDVPQIMVYNKIDLTGEQARVDRDSDGAVRRVWLSAVEGSGIDMLLGVIADVLVAGQAHLVLRIPPEAGKLRARLYAEGVVRRETTDDDGAQHLEIVIATGRLQQLCSNLGLDADQLLADSCAAGDWSLQSGAAAG